jgi:pilus assembly protein Flp/PilA
MANINQSVREFCRNTQAQDLVEYALAAGMVALAVVAVMPSFSTTLNDVFSKIGSIISASTGT